MSVTMPMSPPQANSSMSHSNGGKCPMTGSRKSAHSNWKNALTNVAKSRKNDSATNQCANATIGRRDMRLCPKNSRATVSTRRPGWLVRIRSGWPVLKSFLNRNACRNNRTHPSSGMVKHSTIAVI